MGYTHYFTMVKQPTTIQWSPIRKAMKKIFADKDLGSLVKFESDSTEPPIADDSLIRFNGINEAGHETFYLGREDVGFQFCKTALKPYDSLVTAALILANYYAPECFDIGSDGEPKDWVEGKMIAENVTGRPMEIPIASD